jgi:hypothetical protein
LILGADSLSAAQAYHLDASDFGLQALMLHNVLWRVLGHRHKAATTGMFTDIRDDPYSFHTQHPMVRGRQAPTTTVYERRDVALEQCNRPWTDGTLCTLRHGPNNADIGDKRACAVPLSRFVHLAYRFFFRCGM